MIDAVNALWVEKFRPKTIDEAILPAALKDQLKAIVATGQMSNLMLHGPAGCGKTTAARAMCAEIGADVLFINASLENGIDVLRSKIAQFASSVSLTDSKKVVILDEADYANPQSFQPALRGFIEEFSNNCRFILTCNFKNRLIEPLHSRCAVVEFKITGKDKPAMAAAFFARALSILEAEKITYNKKVVAELVQRYFPDYRRILNELQRYSASGQIDAGLLVNGNETFKALVGMLKSKTYSEVRKWVAINSDGDSARLFRELYDTASTMVEGPSIPELVLIIGEYQYRAAFVVDQEINMMAALTEIMSRCKFL